MDLFQDVANVGRENISDRINYSMLHNLVEIIVECTE